MAHGTADESLEVRTRPEKAAPPPQPIAGGAGPFEGPTLAAVCVLVGLGCYRPTIDDGGFRCNPGPKRCPDGFECDLGALVCRRSGGSTAADGGADGSAVTDARDAADVACFGPVPGCTSVTACDPLCQTGCRCGLKCSVSVDAGLICTPPLAGTPKQVGESCSVAGAGTSTEMDDCAAGLVCLDDGCSGRCYRFCRGDGDCPGSTCTRDGRGGVKVCDVPDATCDPVGRAATETCGAPTMGCYLAAAGSDRTLCDCPFGAAPEGGVCARTRDCLPGLVCLDPAGGGDLRCQPVCKLDGGAGCSTGRTCTPLAGGTTYGYCRA